MILALDFPLQLLGNMFSPLFVGVGTIEDGDFIFLCVDVIDQIVETHLRYHLPHLVKLMIVVIEETTG